MGKLLVKYDVRGIQAFVFRTNKLREIKAVSDLPEKIILETAAEVILSAHELSVINHDKENKTENIVNFLKKYGISFIDYSGGNAIAIIDSREIYEEFSSQMALKILENTYSLRLVYACVDCTEDFCSDYEKLNKTLGALKSSMPYVSHTGPFPICRQDYLTGFPISGIGKKPDETGKKEFLTEESIKKRGYRLGDGTQIDDYILGKGIDSHIAIIHIDGNSMGNRLNNIISRENNVTYDNAEEKFKSIWIKKSFGKVCDEVEEIVEKYLDEKVADAKEKKQDYIRENLVHAVIRAGDDITYITRADIALSFTKLFLKKISREYMYQGNSDGSGKDGYEISACAGIAFTKSHFPFSDAYNLAENCCASAKKRAKQYAKNDIIGNWIDFEICNHIKNTDINTSRRFNEILFDDNSTLYLNMRPYCVGTAKCKDEFFDYDTHFENNIVNLIKENRAVTDEELIENTSNQDETEYKNATNSLLILNRSRAKELRQAYFEGRYALENFKSTAESRKYIVGDLYIDLPENKNIKYASYYDAIEMMDMFNTDFNDYISGICKDGE